MNGNTLKKDFVKAQVYKFKYISESDKNSAKGAGDMSFYAMLPSLGINLGLSLILYFNYSHY